jgi:hypothetical protein
MLPILFGSTGPAPAPQVLLREPPALTIKRFGPSNLIVDQVPDFVNRDHVTFRLFLEAYYEWLEQYQNAFGIIDSFTESTDIDRTIGLFFADFREMYLRGFPYQLATDENGRVVSEANFLKNARNFYGSKGTEKSFRFLFRLIYNVSSQVAYPGKDILRGSDGKWVERLSLKTTSSGGTANYLMEGNRVYQYDPATGQVVASAQVTRVFQYDMRHWKVTEIFIGQPFGDFAANLPIRCDLPSGSLEERVIPVISRVDVLNGGSGYEQADRLGLTGATEGFGASVAIELTDKDGRILSVSVIDSGIGYSDDVDAFVVSNTGDGNASFAVVVSALSQYRGYYSNNDGKLSSTKRLFDGDFYQDFSYVLKSEISFDLYREMYKRLVHPAGFKMFGDILVDRGVIDSLPFHSEMQRYELPYIGHYTPYRMGTTADLYDVYPNGFNPRATVYNNVQNYGSTGGKLFVQPIGFTFGGLTFTSVFATGASGNGITAGVFEFRSLNDGGTYGILLLRGISLNGAGLTAVFGATSSFVGGKTIRMFTATSGFTATVSLVRAGVGVVPETGGFTHDTQGRPLGSSLGVEGYIEAQGFSYDYWRIHHHPNIWGIRGLTGVWNGSTGAGASFGAMALNPFFRMPLGYHFHSSPQNTSYVGTTGDGNEYGLIESPRLTSPNF